MIYCIWCITVMCTVNSIICTSSLLSCNWGTVHSNKDFVIYLLFSRYKFLFIVSCASKVFPSVFLKHNSIYDASKNETSSINVSLIKLVLPKITFGRKTEGTRNTDTEGNQQISQTAGAVYCWPYAICASRYEESPGCQSSAGWKDIDLAHEFVSVLMCPVTTSTKSFSSFWQPP